MAFVSEISSLQLPRPYFRLDAEYFLPDRIAAGDLIKSYPRTAELRSLCSKLTQGPNPIFAEAGIPSLNGKNIYFGSASSGEPNFVSQDEFNRLNSYSLQRGDIVITLKHATKIGRAWIIETDEPLIFSRNVGIIRLRVDSPLSAPALLFYLWSEPGQKILDRIATGGTTGQITLSMAYLGKMLVPIFPEGDQRELDRFYSIYRSLEAESSALRQRADRVLADGLGIPEIDLREEIGYEARMSVVAASRRWDAEFFKPKYARLLEALKQTGEPIAGLVASASLFTLLTNGHTPLRHDLEVGDVLFLTAEHVSDFHCDFTTDKRILLRHHLGELARTALHDGDVLLTIKGKIGNCVVLRNCPPLANINQDVALIKLKPGIHPYFFAAWVNSTIGKQLTQKYSTGGINPFLGLGNVARLPFPLIDIATQMRIGERVRELIEQSQSKANEAVRVLEEAQDVARELILRDVQQ